MAGKRAFHALHTNLDFFCVLGTHSLCDPVHAMAGEQTLTPQLHLTLYYHATLEETTPTNPARAHPIFKQRSVVPTSPHPLAMPLKSEYEVSSPPNDGITRVSFAPLSQSPMLLVSSWDTGVRLYDVSTPEGNMRSMYSHQYPVLDCCMMDSARSFSAGLDRCLKSYDFQASREEVLGQHKKYPYQCLL